VISRSQGGASPAAGPTLPIPDSIGRYEVIDRLATGGMAEVFICTERQMAGLERLVVVKRILPHFAMHDSFVEMFLAEARYVARINHPNVVQIFELGEDSGAPYLSMEYVAGVSLRDLLIAAIELGRPLPVGVAVSLAAQACAGAHAAHDLKDGDGRPLGLVHRDISPHNLMVTGDGHVKLLDFGIAKATEAPGFVDNTRTGALKGKVHYMAPEQCRQEPLDRRADVFALGIVAWELLASERLFKRDSELEAMQAIVGGDRRDLRSIRKDVPTTLLAALEKALAVKREARFPTAEAFKRALLDSVPSSSDVSAEAVAAFLRPLLGASVDARRELFHKAARERAAGERPRTGSFSRGGSRSGVLEHGGHSGESESTLVDKHPHGSGKPRPEQPAVGDSVLHEPIHDDEFGDLADQPTVRQRRDEVLPPTVEGRRGLEPADASATAGTTAAAPLAASSSASAGIPAGGRPGRGRTALVAALVAALTCVVVTAGLLLLPRLRGPAVHGPPLVVAWPPTVEPERLREELALLAEVLERKTQRPVRIEIAANYDDVVERVTAGRAAFGVLPPALFVMTRRAHPEIVPLAMKMVDGSSGSDGVMLVREDSDVAGIAALKGRTFCFPDKRSTTGYVLARQKLIEAGLDPDRDVVARFSGNHTQVLKDLTSGRCDAGATYSGGYLAADRAGIPVGRTRTLAITGRSPQDMIVAGRTASADDRTLLQRALLDVRPRADVGAETVGTLERISGFIAPRLADYDAIERAIPTP
jgi:serine/threonine-protein kinase